MSWNIINADDILAEFTPVERATLEGIQESQTNLASILGSVVNAARGSIAAGGNQLESTPATIPDQIRSDVIAIARWRWLISLPDLGEGFQSKNRKDAATEGQARLDKIAAGAIKVELPVNPTNASVPTQYPSFGTTQLDTSSYAPDA